MLTSIIVTSSIDSSPHTALLSTELLWVPGTSAYCSLHPRHSAKSSFTFRSQTFNCRELFLPLSCTAGCAPISWAELTTTTTFCACYFNCLILCFSSHNTHTLSAETLLCCLGSSSPWHSAWFIDVPCCWMTKPRVRIL